MQSNYPTTFTEILPAWLAHLQNAKRSPRTLALREYQVRRFFESTGLAPNDVTLDHLREWMNNPNWKANTCQVAKSSLSGFFGFAREEHFIKKNPAKRLASPKVPHGAPKPATDQDVSDALAKASPRVQLMIKLGVFIGLRAMEIAAVATSDVVITEAGATLRILGKGSKTRIVPISDDVAELIIYRPDGYLFPGHDNGHLAPATISRYVSKTLPKGVTCHKLRHRFATRAYRNSGNDLRSVQFLLGHASIATTEMYVAVDGESLRRAALSAA